MAKRICFLLIGLFALSLPLTAVAQDLGKLISPGELSVLHKEVDGIFSCTKCHELRGGIPNENCLDCHKKIKKRIDENHGLHSTAKKEKCVKCHLDHKGRAFKMVTLDEKTFDHVLAGYKLTGKHAKTKCLDCHKVKTKKGQVSYLDLKQYCKSCHEDVHKGQLADKCEQCHNANSWKGKDVKLDHDKAYKLRGAHAKEDKIKCKDCHKVKNLFRVKGFEKCITCHEKQDVHKGKLGEKCADCHTDRSWKDAALFNHSKTKYELLGKHLDVKCKACHPKQKDGIFKVEKYDTCSSAGCHDTVKRGAIHGKQFKDQLCSDCHTVKGWKPTEFKHKSKKYRGYKLEGKHAKVKCKECHTKDPLTKAVKYKPIETKTCSGSGCHDTVKRGAIHGKQFKDQLCSDCHTVKGWKPTEFKHDDKKYKGYKLEGKHAKAKCEKCHTKIPFTKIVNYKPIDSKTCNASGCHDTKKRGLIHGDQFKDQLCSNCHTPKDWKPSDFKHDDKKYKGYRLKGKHSDVKCEKCHKKDRFDVVLFKPIETKGCGGTNCHKDEHKGLFKNKTCDQCHTEQDWKKLTLDHNKQSKFPLFGKHAEAKCEKCHVNKVWKPLALACVDCHAKQDVHKGKLGTSCEECHSASNWEPRKFFHQLTGFELSGSHTQMECVDCHKQKGMYGGLSQGCATCHTDPHFNQFGSFCEDCHNAKFWAPEKFRHTQTGFRLEGVHRMTDCEDCHKNRFYRSTPSDCYSCHMADFFSPRAASFHDSSKTDCAECHKVYSWSPAIGFGHKTMTFTGSHNEIQFDCEKCHVAGSSQLIYPGAVSESDCGLCHASAFSKEHGNGDPPGLPACPMTCDLCHDTRSFDGAKDIIPCD